MIWINRIGYHVQMCKYKWTNESNRNIEKPHFQKDINAPKKDIVNKEIFEK